MRPVTGVSPGTFQGRCTRILVLGECGSSETRGSQTWETSGALGCVDFLIFSSTLEGEGCYQDGFIPRGLDEGKDKRYNRGSLTPSLWPPSLSSLAASTPHRYNAAFPGPPQTVLDAALLPDAPVSGPRWDFSASSSGFPVPAQGQDKEESSCASPGNGTSPHNIIAWNSWVITPFFR